MGQGREKALGFICQLSFPSMAIQKVVLGPGKNKKFTCSLQIEELTGVPYERIETVDGEGVVGPIIAS